MKTLLLAGTVALASLAGPLAAQESMAVGTTGTVYVLTPEQETMVAAWPAERVTMYKAWPYNLQEYYWTLDAPRQDGWWVLDDAQRTQVYAMTPEQRDAAWASILAQMASATPAPAASDTAMAATTAAPMASSGSPQFVAREVVQTAPASATATANVDGKDLPVCKADQQDGCINSWEKNKTGNRPLNYWPGKPASEIDGKMPANPSGE